MTIKDIQIILDTRGCTDESNDDSECPSDGIYITIIKCIGQFQVTRKEKAQKML